MITSNLAFGEWIRVFGDARMISALLDRLAHQCHIVETSNENYRHLHSAAVWKRRIKAREPSRNCARQKPLYRHYLSQRRRVGGPYGLRPSRPPTRTQHCIEKIEEQGNDLHLSTIRRDQRGISVPGRCSTSNGGQSLAGASRCAVQRHLKRPLILRPWTSVYEHSRTLLYALSLSHEAGSKGT